MVMPGTLLPGRRHFWSVHHSLEYCSIHRRGALGALSGGGTVCAQTLAPCDYFVDPPFEWPFARPAGGARYPVRSRAGEYLEVIFQLHHVAVARLGGSPDLPAAEYLMGGRQALGAWLAHVPNSVQTTLVFFFLIFMLRKQWLAVAGFTLIFTGIKLLNATDPI